MNQLIISTVLIFGFSVAQAGFFSKHKDPPKETAGIHFADTVPSNQVSLMTKDLQILKSLIVIDETGEAARLFKIEPSAPAYEAWLFERSKYVLPESFELNESTVKILDQSYQFPNSIIPKMTIGKTTTPGGAVKTVMSNIGAGLYLAGKKSTVLFGIDIPGVGIVAATSPRAGLFKVGEGMFMPLLRKSGGTDFESYANSLVRLAVFFHESRHSDGNGTSLGFLHGVCPEGHSYAGYNACDENLNGPYTMGAVFLRSIVKSCTECSEAEKEALRNSYTDSFSRVIPEVSLAPSETDSALANARATIKETCATLIRLNVDISNMDSCKNPDSASATPTVLKSTELDDTPEVGPRFSGGS